MEEAGPRRGSAVVVLILVAMALVSLQGVSSLVSDSADRDPGEAQGREPEGSEDPQGPGALLPTASIAPSPSAEGPTEPDDGVDVASLRFTRFLHAYPRRCLSSVERPPVGRFAAFQGGVVSMVAPGSRSVVRVDATKPVAWSPSGRYLATGRGDLYRPTGRGAGSLLDNRSSLWEWSTISDCAIGVHRLGLSVDSPAFDARVLLEMSGVEQMTFSPDGRRLGFVLAATDGRGPALSLWIADLEREVARRLTKPAHAIHLLGWNVSGTQLLYGAAARESVAADGVRLRSTGSGRRSGAGVRVLAHDGSLVHCGTRDLVVAGAGRESNLNKRLAYMTSTGPSYITPTSAAVTSPSCSSDGGFIAVVALSEGANLSTRRLAVLRSDGSFERFLAPDGSGDEYPVWGPPGTGLAFIRMRPSRKLADVWFIAEGASARPTPLAVAVPPSDHGHHDWAEVFDWSAAP